MGYGVMPYAVPPAAWTVIGSRDEARLTELDQWAGEIDELLGDELPPARELLRHMIMGEPYVENAGFAYGYWLKYVCEAYGEMLPNGAWMPIRIDFLDHVQRALTRAGVPAGRVSVHDIIFGGPPVPLPPIDDFPGIAHTPRDETESLLAALESGKPVEETDVYVRAAVEELRSWLSFCARNRCDLVCFYH